MNDPTQHGQDPLSRLLHETVDGIEPQPGLEAIRTRTMTSSSKESTMSIARTWLLGGLGGAVATAAVIGGVYLASNNDPADEPGPVTPPSSSSSSPGESTSPAGGGSSSATPGKTVAVPVYYAGDAADGTYLYREFIRVDENDRLADALRAAINGAPADPDYRSLWPSAAVHGVHVDGAGSDLELTIDLGGKELHDRPSGMSEREAQLAIEQLIYTVQGAAGSGRPPVRFLLDGDITDQVLGVPTSEPLANGELLDTLSHINLTTPAEGDEITGDTLEVSGVANSFEANVVIRLQRYEGNQIVFEEPLTAEGYMEPKLFPFSGSFDVSRVPAGTYVLSATTDDPSDGEGRGAFTDTKVITIK
jgi:hypothetical protein